MSDERRAPDAKAGDERAPDKDWICDYCGKPGGQMQDLFDNGVMHGWCWFKNLVTGRV
jgi:hypothetical protein